MHYDVVIIGAGMSGLAAGIRLAHFEKRVCIVERHYAFGGLNSYYTIDGRAYDVGLHAVTNYTPPGHRQAPLSKLLRQLRLTHEDFDLHPQRFSEIHFPGRRLRFSNDVELLTTEVAAAFPKGIDGFRRLLAAIRDYDDLDLSKPYQATRAVLRDFLGDAMLVEMLLCPVMYYGSAEAHDMDFTQFVTMFKSLFLEGFARPRDGVRTIIKAVVRRFRDCGGKIMMRCGVDRIESDGCRATALHLSNGDVLTADTVISSAGYRETMRLCDDAPAAADQAAEPTGASTMTFVETIGVMDELPHRLGHESSIVFFCDTEQFHYEPSDGLVDLRSGVVCCPTNYEGHDDLPEGLLRLTWIANYDAWSGLDTATYAASKNQLLDRFRERAAVYVPCFAEHLIGTDMFTPLTIERYTGHLHGAVYGSPQKRRDGRTHLDNLFLCGTDQGFLGIIGAMLSGITMANLHVLSDQ